MEALEEKFTAEGYIENGIEYYVESMPKEVYILFGGYIFKLKR